MTEKLNICGVEDDDAPDRRCVGVPLGEDGRCIAHTDDRESRDAAFQRLSEGGALDFTPGVPIDGDLLSAVLETCPRCRWRPVLTNADFRASRFASGCNFWGVVLHNVSFAGAIFGHWADFGEARFAGPADFAEASFGVGVDFLAASFGGIANFRQASFRDQACFSGTRFDGRCDFSGTTFGDEASFWGAIFRGWAEFSEAKFGKCLDFRDVSVTATANFQAASFGGHPEFDDSTFGNSVSFADASFGDQAEFEGASFGDEAGFDRASFAGRASFYRASFAGQASFDRASFGDRSSFIDASFGDAAWFDGASFGDEASFGGASFGDRAWFGEASFGDGAQFGPLLVRGDIVLPYATLSQPERIELACRRMVLHRLRLPGGVVAFRVRWAEIGLSEADLSAPTILSPLPMDGLPKKFRNALPPWASTDDRQARPRIVSLQRGNVAGLILTDVDLGACQFAGAHNLDKLRLEGNTTFAFPPRGWRGWHGAGWRVWRWRVWRWTRRDTLSEEQRWRARPEYGKRAGWYTEETRAVPRTGLDDDHEPLDPRRIAALYRDLRKAREDGKDEPGAADFYYGEMEMRRHAAKPVERAILWLYWAVSGYGLRASRALVALVLLIVLLVAPFQLCGFANPAEPFSKATQAVPTTKPEPWSACRPDSLSEAWSALTDLDAWTYTAGSAVAVFGGPEAELTRRGRVFRIVLRVLSPILLGLAVLSVRGRVKR